MRRKRSAQRALFSRGFEYSFDRLYNTMDKNGDVNTSAEISLFFASFRHNDYTFSLSVRSDLVWKGLDREIARFIQDGTLNFYGKMKPSETQLFI